MGLPLSQPLCWGLANGIPGVLRFRPSLWGLKHFDITLQYDFRERVVKPAKPSARLHSRLDVVALLPALRACATRRAASETYRVRFRNVRKALESVRLFRIAGASPPYPSTIPPLIEPSSIIWRCPVRAERSRGTISVVAFFFSLSAFLVFAVFFMIRACDFFRNGCQCSCDMQRLPICISFQVGLCETSHDWNVVAMPVLVGARRARRRAGGMRDIGV